MTMIAITQNTPVLVAIERGSLRTPSLFTHQIQANSCRCSRRVAAIIERIDLGVADNLMCVLICLTALDPRFYKIC